MRMNAATNGAFRILMICRTDRLVAMQEMVVRLGLAEAAVGTVDHRQGDHAGAVLGLPGHALEWLEGAAGDEQSFVDA